VLRELVDLESEGARRGCFDELVVEGELRSLADEVDRRVNSFWKFSGSGYNYWGTSPMRLRLHCSSAVAARAV